MTWILNSPQVPHIEGLILNATVFREMWAFGRILHCEGSGLMNRLIRFLACAWYSIGGKTL